MRIAVTGTTGRVGAALARHFSENHEVIPLPRRICDLTDSASLAAALDGLECDVFINPAGITSLEICEDDPALAMRVNTEAPAEIAAWAAGHRVRLVHFSTDYVFDGESGGLRVEDDPAIPVNTYGRSKLAGERAVLAGPENCVVRVSWIFGPERESFIDHIYAAALAGRPLAAVTDKFSLPAYTRDLAEWIECLVERNATGVFHACNSGEPVSWHGMATAAVEAMAAGGILPEIPLIREHYLSEMTSFRAVRPRFTAMDTGRLTDILGQEPRPWWEAISEYIREKSLA